MVLVHWRRAHFFQLTFYLVFYEKGSSFDLPGPESVTVCTNSDVVFFVVAYIVVCRPDGIQCPMTDSCLRNSELCDGQADCAVSGYDESPVICGTYVEDECISCL